MKIFFDVDICLNLLDRHREQSDSSIALYMHYKSNPDIEFYYSGDAISTIYTVLTNKRELDQRLVVQAIEALSLEVNPIYLTNDDFVVAKRKFYARAFDNLESLMILESAMRQECNIWLTQNEELLKLGEYESIKILSPSSFIATLNQ